MIKKSKLREQMMLNKVTSRGGSYILGRKISAPMTTQKVQESIRTKIRPFATKHLNKNNLNKHRWLLCIDDLLPQINALFSYETSKYVNEIKSLIYDDLRHKGEMFVIKFLKSLRLCFQRYYLNQPKYNLTFTKADRHGIPKKGKFLKVSKHSLKKIRYVMSVLRIFESFKMTPTLETKPIVDTSTADDAAIEEIINFIPKSKLLKLLPDTFLNRVILTNKSGPNGPGVLACVTDLMALSQNPALYEACKRMYDSSSELQHIDGDNQVKDIRHSEPPHKLLVSKIACIADKFGRTRVVAIGDGWSNCSLSGLHDAFMQALSSIRGDFSYKQEKLPEGIKSLGTTLYSSDMTAFTDRFPRKIIKEIVRAKYGQTVAEDWETIISNRDFYTSDGTYIRYSVGTPMGFLSSWATSTFAHHLITEFACMKAGRKFTNYKYVILGDDKVDSSFKVYLAYQAIIRSIGVEISEVKGTRSFFGFVEVAKRLYTPLGEITGLPVSMLKRLGYDPSELLEFLKLSYARGFTSAGLRVAFDSFLDKIATNSGTIRSKNIVKTILTLPTSVSSAPFKVYDTKCDPGVTDQHPRTLEDIESLLLLARHKVFLRKINYIFDMKPTQMTEVSKFSFTLTDIHPLIVTLNYKIEAMSYLGTKIDSEGGGESDELLDFQGSTDECSIYNAGMRGDYMDLARLPVLHSYNKKFTDSRERHVNKYDVLSELVLLLQSKNTNDFLIYVKIFTDSELYQHTYELYRSELHNATSLNAGIFPVIDIT